MTPKTFRPTCYTIKPELDLFDPDTWPEPETNIEARQQSDMFIDAGSVADLPLFSGTAPRQTVKPFIETDTAPKQTKMQL